MGAISIFQDITSEEELLSELADIKQFMNVLQLIFDNAYLGIVFVDSNGIIQFMNRMYRRSAEYRQRTRRSGNISPNTFRIPDYHW